MNLNSLTLNSITNMKKLFSLALCMLVGLSETYSGTKDYQCCQTVTVSTQDSDGNNFSASATYCAGSCYIAGAQAGIMANHALNVQLLAQD
jgi:hypothetical protein